MKKPIVRAGAARPLKRDQNTQENLVAQERVSTTPRAGVETRMNAETGKRPSATRAGRADWDDANDDLGGDLDEYYQDEVLVDWDALEEVRALFADRYDGEQES